MIAALRYIFRFILYLQILLLFVDGDKEVHQIQELKKIIADQCAKKYTKQCLLVDLVKVIDKLGTNNTYRLLPGLYLVQNGGLSQDIPATILMQTVHNLTSDPLEVFVRQKLNAYLDSLSLSLKIMDQKSAVNLRKFSDHIITEILPSTDLARKKKNSKKDAMWAAGMLAALGTGALFAVTGKAALISMAALLLSFACYYRGFGSAQVTAGHITSAQYAKQCPEAVIDLHGRDFTQEKVTALIGVKKRTDENPWGYSTYANPSEYQPT